VKNYINKPSTVNIVVLSMVKKLAGRRKTTEGEMGEISKRIKTSMET